MSNCSNLETITSLAKDAWSAVLAVLPHEITNESSFLEGGGDSLDSMNLYGLLLEAGIQIQPEDYYRCKTFGDLIEEAIKPSERKPHLFNEAHGEILLTPGASWFLSNNGMKKNHFNIAWCYKCLCTLNDHHLEKAIRSVAESNRSLRKRYVGKNGKWNITDNEAYKNCPILEVIDYSDLDARHINAAFAKKVDDAQRSLDLEQGIIYRFIKFRLPEESGDRIVFILHHLALDGYSAAVFRKHVWSIYDALQNNELSNIEAPVNFCPNSIDSDQVGELFKRTVSTDLYKVATSMWRSELHSYSLCLDNKDYLNQNIFKYNSAVEVRLSKKQTDLLRYACSQHGYSLGDIIAISLSIAASNLFVNFGPVIMSVNSARRSLMKKFNVDVSRTIGWLAITSPIIIGKTRHACIKDYIFDTNRAQDLKRLKDAALYYEAACWFDDDAEMVKIPTSCKIVVNFLGVVDTKIPEENKYVDHADVPLGSHVSEKSNRDCRFFALSFIADGRLTIKLNFSRRLEEISAMDDLQKKLLSLLGDFLNGDQ